MGTIETNFSEDAQAVDILIVGAGPTGLTLANDLLRRKVSFRIIDKAASATTISKAIVVHARNLEMFENLKMVEPFLKAGLALRGSNIFADGKRIVHLSLDEIDSHFKFALTIPQDKTEQLLADRLTAAGMAIERSKELISFVEESEGIAASVAGTASDGSIRTEIIKAKYLVGCDGAHSAVRHTLDLRFTGVAYDESFGAADVELNPGTLNLAEDEGYVYLSEDGLLACFPFGSSRYRLIFDMPPLGENEERRPLVFEEVLALVKRRGPKDGDANSFTISNPRWMAWFKINRRCVTSYRKGRVFLAGDSAHIHSPVGGVGMNTGMQDAANLSWKLALVVKGQAGDFLLDSYNLERHAVGQAVLAATDFATKAVTLRSPVAKGVRNTLMGFLASQEIVQQRILKAGSLTGISYRKSPISSESHASLKELLERNLHLKPVADGSSTSGENLTMLSWLDFARAPLAGDRVVDRECQTRHGDTRLAQVMASPNFQLLLFDGFEASTRGYEQFLAIEKMIQAQFFGLIDVHVILPYCQNAPQYHSNYDTFNTYTSVLFDTTKELHRAYGASSECLYLIRPDGYIGFRSQPAVAADLENYLKAIFKR